MELLNMTLKKQIIAIGLSLFILFSGGYIVYIIVKVFQFQGEPVIFPTGTKDNSKLI